MTAPTLASLQELGWQARLSCNGRWVFQKYGTYGWFSAEAAWKHQEEVLDRGRGAAQYPTELMPPCDFGQRLKEEPQAK